MVWLKPPLHRKMIVQGRNSQILDQSLSFLRQWGAYHPSSNNLKTVLGHNRRIGFVTEHTRPISRRSWDSPWLCGYCSLPAVDIQCSHSLPLLTSHWLVCQQGAKVMVIPRTKNLQAKGVKKNLKYVERQIWLMLRYNGEVIYVVLDWNPWSTSRSWNIHFAWAKERETVSPTYLEFSSAVKVTGEIDWRWKYFLCFAIQDSFFSLSK